MAVLSPALDDTATPAATNNLSSGQQDAVSPVITVGAVPEGNLEDDTFVEAEGTAFTDKRVDWLSERVLVSLKLPKYKWDRHILFQAERRERIVKFLDGTIEDRLILFYHTADERDLVLDTRFPPRCGAKMIVFCKANPVGSVGPITLANIATELICEELAPDLLPGLQSVVDGVYLPLVANAKVGPRWPKVVASDVHEALGKFSSASSFLDARTKGNSVLPMPPLPAGSDVDSDRRRTQILEATLVEWTAKVKAVSEEDVVAEVERLEQHGRHPSPLFEVDFWRRKYATLSALHQQLESDSVQRVLTTLQSTGSSYLSGFRKLLVQLSASVVKAHDLHVHMEALRPLLITLHTSSFAGLHEAFAPVLHVLALMWFTSNHVTSARLISLIRLIVNDIIAISSRYLDGASLLHIEGPEAAEKIRKALRTCGYFKQLLFSYRVQVNVRSRQKQWKFENTHVFSRLDAFMERLQDVDELCNLRAAFSKLETFQIGGNKGEDLGNIVAHVYHGFMEAAEAFHNLPYDILDLSTTFEAQLSDFNKKVKDFDRRLCYVIAKAFEECSNLTESFKLVEIFESQAGRHLIKSELEAKVGAILHQYSEEMNAVTVAFQQQQDSPPAAPGLSGVTAALMWVRGLIERIRWPMEKFKFLGRAFTSTPDWQGITSRYDQIMGKLMLFEGRHRAQWQEDTRAVVKPEILRQPVFIKQSNGMLVVNFSWQLASVMEQVRQLQQLDVVPSAEVLQLQDEYSEKFRQWNLYLDAIATQHNQILSSIIDVERPLLRRYLEEMDLTIQDGLGPITWVSPSVPHFIERARAAVSQLHSYLLYLKGNIRVVESILRSWKDMWKVMHFTEEERHERRKRALLLDVVQLWRGETRGKGQAGMPPDPDIIARKWVFRWKARVSMQIDSVKDIEKQNRRIHRLVASSRALLQVDPASGEWRMYLDYITGLFKRGFVLAVKSSLLHLLKVLEVARGSSAYGLPLLAARKGAAGPPTAGSTKGKDQTAQPLLLVRLEMVSEQPTFTPSITEGDTGCIQAEVHEWANGVFSVARLLTRLDNPSESYYGFISENPELTKLRAEIVRQMQSTIDKMTQVRQDYLKYSFLWVDDSSVYVRRFAKGEFLHSEGLGFDLGVEDFRRDTEVEDELSGGKSPQFGAVSAGFVVGSPKFSNTTTEIEKPRRQKPTLAEFEQQIHKYEQLYMEILELPGDISYGWLKLNANPLRATVAALAQRWRLAFLAYLRDRVLRKLNKLYGFIAEIKHALESIVVKDYDSLVRVMEHIGEFSRRTEKTDNMFDPLQEVVVLLKRHEIPLDADKLVMLEDAPVKWRELKRAAFQVNESLTPMQSQEVAKIRQMEEEFISRSERFREHSFLKKAPFSFTIHTYQCYAVVQQLHIQVVGFESQLEQLQQRQRLFQLMINPGRAIKECRSDLQLLKQLWDVVSVILYQLEAWNKVAFTKLLVDEMEEQAKRFTSLLHRSLDKRVRVRAWDAYQGIETRLKNFLVSLPLIQNLRNPAMKDRHWQELMSKTGVKFDLRDDFTLQDLLALKLHHFVDEVGLIVDKAVKQQHISKQLAQLQTIWRDLKFQFEFSDDADYPTFRVPEELLTLVEEHQVLLQNLATNRFVSIYLEDVQTWQATIARVEAVMTLFGEVQHTWEYLQGIFLRSDDIREQLPEDTTLFRSLDQQMKVVLRSAHTTPTVIELCAKEGLENRLQEIQKQLAKCEKALDLYLEEKRKAFPRFYFVSTPDLLDILSKGGQSCHAMMRHLPKIFPAFRTLHFQEQGRHLSSTTIGIVSREGEYLPLLQGTLCEGRVEDWLHAVLNASHRSVHNILEASIIAYSERPRDIWLHEFPSQIVLVTSQIAWTMEVVNAFAMLEEGNESAMKDYRKKQEEQLAQLIAMVQTNLSEGERQKVMNLVTYDVHARDIVADLITAKIDSESSFMWQKQLRQRWDDKQKACFLEICDTSFEYGYEYLGNAPRLVITPLTDRIYITLTQSLHLRMGGAPAGPAGTGKTETTKDLGAQMGKPVYVFNCSDQMNSKSLGTIFKGLAASGTWGCFDEFNRIAVEVLSVVSSQFKSILDAIKAGRQKFFFGREEITLDPTCGIFITMNPGYLGRTELPESLKALFRPVTVVVPDLALICENMLMAQGFVQARILAKKFITLFRLNADLLSKQDHYDWGLRAIKSLLVVAGSLKRAEPDVPEESLLLRALRDFNLPKIVASDLDVFAGLIQDLFPSVTIPRKQDKEFEAAIRRVAANHGLQAEEGLVLKTVQLEELLRVRHSIFILGPAGAGKSTCWKSLSWTLHATGKRVILKDLNPKAVSSHELYGHMTVSKEWRDGLLSSIMRDMATRQSNETKDGKHSEQTNQSETDEAQEALTHKWIVLDGDLDTEWIESMNSVMDDNKLLTLASNERIAMLPSMRLIFEISHLKYATPATVSRAGIIFINETDIGWLPFVQSWCEERNMSNVVPLVDKYVGASLEYCKVEFNYVVPVSEFNLVQTLCYLLEGLLPQLQAALAAENSVTGGSSAQVQSPEKDIELLFVFACVWAFGGGLTTKEGIDYRARFDKWWRGMWKSVKFPELGTVFDYCINTETRKFERWADHVRPPPVDGTIDLASPSLLIPTAGSVCLSYFHNLLVKQRRPLMFVGNAGCGKTLVVKNALRQLPEDVICLTINFNYYTTAASLQKVLEQSLEKKMGRVFAPPGQKRMVVFIDDVNMSQVDKYGTQTPMALLRQHLDYQHWYDRAKWKLKEIRELQYVACMNPTAGSFTVNPRFQRHFATFAVPMPTNSMCFGIYHRILASHVACFARDVVKITERLVHATLELHEKVTRSIQKTAAKFHYEFNLRHLSSLFHGLLRAHSHTVPTAAKLLRLWVHEASRVYGDRLTDDEDSKLFSDLLTVVCANNFQNELDVQELLREPLLFCSFLEGNAGPESPYDEVPDYATLHKLLEGSLQEYNDTFPQMNIVLFEAAMAHVCRICRIIEGVPGNALIVGVGGSGKQSLTRLAAFISGFTVATITISATYDLQTFKDDLKAMYLKAGLKGDQVLFLFTDTQIFDERALVDVNDMLSSGDIPDLFANEEKDDIVRGLRTEVRAAYIVDTRENCWAFFLEKVRRRLHVVLSFSPVGDAFRIRSRRFPALVNCCAIDWFHPWPTSALMSVARRFLQDTDLGVLKDDVKRVRAKVVEFMAFAHYEVKRACQVYNDTENRHVYATPKSYLELIDVYRRILSLKLAEIDERKGRLETGMQRLHSAAEDVAGLQEQLTRNQSVVREKKAASDELLTKLEAEKAVVAAENRRAEEEEAKAVALQTVVLDRARECEDDLARAEPLVQRAKKALETLNKTNLLELKSFKAPPPDVQDVLSCVLILLSPPNEVIREKDRNWANAQRLMQKVDVFLQRLLTFDKENIPPSHILALKPYLAKADFNGNAIQSKSFAAAGLCEWVINIEKYHQIHCFVQPKREQVEESKIRLEQANRDVAKIKAQVNKLKAKLADLQSHFDTADRERQRVVEEAEQTALRLDLAQRLVSSLSSENERWLRNVEQLTAQRRVTVGDVVLAAAFVVYIGPFNYSWRHEILTVKWLPWLKSNEVPMSLEGADPLVSLTTSARVALWRTQGLPSDTVSTQNAAIMESSQRWPLLIDPQQQGLTWIKNRERQLCSDHQKTLHVVSANSKSLLETLEKAIAAGDTVIMEGLGESIDPILTPVLGRKTIRRSGGLEVIQLGDKEVDYDNTFRLILQSRLSNPHYTPEIQAETSLINFTVTQEGLEEQLLALVVNRERSELEQQKTELIQQNNRFFIRLEELEDLLIEKISTTAGDILQDKGLIESLERMKATCIEIEEKVQQSKVTEHAINATREAYRPVAHRGSLMYFLINGLHQLEDMYQFSLHAFIIVFTRALESCDESDSARRIQALTEAVTFSVFNSVRRGLFERHKLVFAALTCFTVLESQGQLQPVEIQFLLRGPHEAQPAAKVRPAEWITVATWSAILDLAERPGFEKLPADIESGIKRWKEWTDLEAPERERLPGEWRQIDDFYRLVIIRAFRPDRFTAAITQYVRQQIGTQYVEQNPFQLSDVYREATPASPFFFILFPGADPVKEVEKLGLRLGYSADHGNFTAVAMGEEQEEVAMEAINTAVIKGGWVMLQNIHLMKRWLAVLDAKLEWLAVNVQGNTSSEDDTVRVHANFRLYLSAEPSPDPQQRVPQGILQKSLKLINEPPQSLKANLSRALSSFGAEAFEGASKSNEFKSVLFALCFFHALVLGRKRFGAQGWSRSYSFNTGDLLISGSVLHNYLESAAGGSIPWEDIRYIFGEIMYGGHITDEWDRRTCATYLATLLNDHVLTEGELAHGLPAPPVGTYGHYIQFVETRLPEESPVLFGLHPNAEVKFLTREADNLCAALLVQTRGDDMHGAMSSQRENRLQDIIDEILAKVPEPFNLNELSTPASNGTQQAPPFVAFVLQECERMNILLNSIKSSLNECTLGLKGKLTISEGMDELLQALDNGQVPATWTKVAYPSLQSLRGWVDNLTQRVRHLEVWANDFVLPKSVWISGLFNPMAFLTAVMQTTARKSGTGIDRMVFQTEVLKKHEADVQHAPREGAHVHGLFLEGAKWDVLQGLLANGELKELHQLMPVIHVKALPVEKRESKNVYQCPVYMTALRSTTYAFTAQLRTQDPPSKWTLAGVALLMNPDS
eukprot:TRINITY_DN24443_c0_g2_i1.p1 TRINITY_DN24443_c0_g2~~TRINITY_DN24443_c0_g2_i1.p1  ORF type:complete len:4685 (-),score=794.60 TRINITY_DN24443_c0_g2_i1:231-14285(-)